MSKQRWNVPTALLIFALVGSACDAGKEGPASHRGAWSTGQEWRVVEEARIGSVDGDETETFGSVVDVALDATGRVWIADGQRNRLVVFDQRGKHVRSVGAKGGGPREFAGIAGMDWAPDGRLWVLDGGNARFAIYDTTGKLVRTKPRVSVITSSPWPGGFDKAGRLYDIGVVIRPDASFHHVVLRSDSTLQRPDTFPLPEFKDEAFEVRRGDARNGTVHRLVIPFSGSQIWNFDPEGYVWVANTANYRFDRHSFGGGVERVVQREVPRVPVTRADRARIEEDARAFVKQGGKIDMSRIPSSMPALNPFVFDDTGHLWSSPVTTEKEGRALDVFELNGKFLGRVPLPTGMRSSPRAIRGDRMVVVARDSLDVENVILLRVVKPGG
jgi:sugar lactone lactonase YvrE